MEHPVVPQPKSSQETGKKQNKNTFWCLHYGIKEILIIMKGYVLTIFVIVIMPSFVRAIFGGEDVKDPHKYPWIVKVISQYV